jgi:LuxR family maltose regulon positive regulatory protein
MTKLTMPALPRPAVRRPRLHQLLDAGAGGKLTLVVAPAGYGKTVLVTDWLSSALRQGVGWVSLDKTDNEPATFWAYVLAALSCAGVGLPPAGCAPAELTRMGPPEQSLAPLVNVLIGLTADVTLVLDAYHLIADPRIHSGLAFLIDHQPPRLHLVILSRSDPPFPLARWTASGEVVQARTRDLAFTAGEMTVFLRDHGVTLPPDLAEPLFARLEGWPAALRLATLWVSGRDDADTAIAEFAASDATISDYLMTEVLNELPAGLRRFLLQTSILSQLAGPLCDAVTAQGGGAQALAELDRRGLFVEPLAPGRDWLRYHHLFAELLHLELERAYPVMIAELHRRASRWFAANGFAADAIEHGIIGGDWVGVRALMLSETLAIGSRYAPSVVEGWLSSLPRRVLDTSPFFLVLDAFVLAHTGRPGQARHALRRSANLARLATTEPELSELGALRHAIAAGIARLDCDLAAVRRSALALRQHEERVGDGQTELARMARAAVANALAATTFWHGDTDSAEQLLRETERETAAHQLMRMRVNCMSVTALLLASTGRLRQAEALAAEALRMALSVGVVELFQASPALLAKALLSVQRAEHSVAREQLAVICERARGHKDRAPLLAAGILLARLAALRGDVGGAFAILDEAKAASPGWHPPPALQAMIAEDEARICLLGGDIAAARAVHGQLATLPGQVPAVTLATQLTWARILRAEGHGVAASALFGMAADAAIGHGQLTRAVEAHVGAAVASRLAGQDAAALTCLTQALALAQDETIAAPFIWEAVSVRQLLLHMEQRPYPALGFRQRLLEVMGIPAGSARQEHLSRTSVAQTLSDRELTVLRLLGGKLTNLEIASALTISPNTLKTHVKHIYRKLGVNSRQQALIRSRSSTFSNVPLNSPTAGET